MGADSDFGIQPQRQPYDKSSKWLIQHHGDSMLWLAEVKNIRAWRPAQAKLVQPRRLPDGLLEVSPSIPWNHTLLRRIPQSSRLTTFFQSAKIT